MTNSFVFSWTITTLIIVAIIILWFPVMVWLQIHVLESVPDINLLDYLPEILDGLFQILGDSSKEIRRMYVSLSFPLPEIVSPSSSFLCFVFIIFKEH